MICQENLFSDNSEWSSLGKYKLCKCSKKEDRAFSLLDPCDLGEYSIKNNSADHNTIIPRDKYREFDWPNFLFQLI